MRDSVDFRQVEPDGARQSGDGAALTRAWRAFVQALFQYLGRRFQGAQPWLDHAQDRFVDLESVVRERGRATAESAQRMLRGRPVLGLVVVAVAAALANGLRRR